MPSRRNPPVPNQAPPETAASRGAAASSAPRSSYAAGDSRGQAPETAAQASPTMADPLHTVSHAGRPCPGLAECPERPRLVRRLWTSAEREIEATERWLGEAQARPPDAAAKRLGALAATLDRLAALDRKALGARTRLPGEADDASPFDADAIDGWAQRIAGKLAEDDDGAPLPADAG